MKQKIFAMVLGLIVAGFALAAHAAWPERTVTVIVPYPPGGTVDTVGRIAADWLAKALRQSAIVEHRPGAGGAIAAEYLSRVPADGYTLILGSTGTMEKLPQMPDVPTIAEQGYPAFSAAGWNALFAPAGTPKEVISKLADALKPACEDAGFIAKLDAIGVDALCNTPEQFAERLRAEWAMWGEAVKVSGLAIE